MKTKDVVRNIEININGDKWEAEVTFGKTGDVIDVRNYKRNGKPVNSVPEEVFGRFSEGWLDDDRKKRIIN